MIPCLLPDDLCVATIQWNISRIDRHKNIDAVERLLPKAAAQNAHIAILPELWSCSFCGSALLAEAEALNERLQFLKDMAITHKIWIGGTLPEPADGKRVFNTLYLVDSQGNIRSTYRKMHLFPLTREPEFFLPGKNLPDICDAGPWKIGFGICYDLRFPELFRLQAKQGANLFIVPAQFPNPRREAYRLLARARALDAQACTVCVNRVGEDGSLSYFGGSMVSDSYGNIVFEMDSQEGCQICRLRASEVLSHRKTHPFLEVTPLLYAVNIISKNQTNQ